MPTLRHNPLRARLRSGSTVLGTFVEIPSPYVMEILGLAGFDFAIIDREHGAIDLGATENMIRAAAGTGISPIVRVASDDPVLIRQPLDMGAAGIHVPQIGTAEAAGQAVRSALFGPMGHRGMQPFVRAASFRAGDMHEYLAQQNEDVLIVVHIEGEEGVRELDRILEIERLDVIFIGPYDLSQSLGIPGQVTHPRVEQKIQEIIAMARDSGKHLGIYCDNVAAAKRWRAAGVSYLALGLDAHIFLNAARGLVNELKE